MINLYLLSSFLKLKPLRSSYLKRSSPSGFSLLESLIAVAVVSILIVAIAPMVALSNSARVNARRVDQATQAARSYIDAVRGGVIDTSQFPDSLVPLPNAQGQYLFDTVAAPTNASLLSLSGTTVKGIRVDTNGNGFSTDDPQDLVIQPMRSGPRFSVDPASTASTLSSRGFWLGVRVYRADVFAGGATLQTGTNKEICGRSQTPFVSTASTLCPIVTMRSQILPTTDANNLDDIKLGTGKGAFD